MWERVRRWLPFVSHARRPEPDEALAALLARREQVRAAQTAPAVQPSPELFQPINPEAAPLFELSSSQSGGGKSAAVAEPESPATAAKPAEEMSTASRLLEAKRRAQQRIK